MRIGELAGVTEVPARLLRYYEAQGLLRPSRSTNGYRSYDESAATTVRQIRGLLAAGLSTDEIRQLLPCATDHVPALEPCTEVLDLLDGRLAGLDERIRALTGAREALWRYVSVARAAAGAPTASRCEE